MISVFSSKNSEAYRSAKSLLDANGINHYTKEDYLSNLKYTSYKIFIEEEDFEKSREVLKQVAEERTYYYEDFDLVSVVASMLILFLVLAVIWVKSDS